VISSNAFHHFADPVKVLKESKRVLKAGGSVRILDETADNPAAKWIDRVMGRVEQGHVRLYSTREFMGFFDQAGLNYVSTVSVLPAIKIHVALRA
jgi:ubiquinone/menaquinone biosynthesis C-methylase UbiE